MMSSTTSATLWLDAAKAKANIRFMAEKAAKHGLRLRPHLKTPQSIDVARWYKEVGVTGVTVSSIAMAEYFASDGWNDITLAMPLNVRELPRILALASRITLNLVIDSEAVVNAILHGVGATDPYVRVDGIDPDERAVPSIFIKIDAGYHRTGIPADHLDQIEQLVNKIRTSPGLDFGGFLTHAGHSYNCRSHSEIRALHQEQLRQLQPLNRFGGIISIGDTPTCTVADDFSGIGEIRPGNFIYYDMKMVQISACETDRISVCMVAPVISNHPDRNEVILHGGSVHFSKDSMTHVDGSVSYGQVVRLTDTGWAEVVGGAYLKSLCQEHGFVTGPPEFIQSLKIGDLVGVLPVHSCLTADCMGEIRTLDGGIFKMMK
jgi:D-serine deaminase-like pyridoxal phosphate-dependent protein